ncbi:MAG: 2-oxoacid:acceptor oxidoreductase family protein [Dysosmobacter sp.]|nr:2-oxoacid:acceptor oxidoreductase family protein [Dysosmobacter sp.]
MEKTFFISGIGGQGVQVLCKALAKVVDDCGMNMCLYPWYQGQRRGGATFGRLIISDDRIGAPEKRNYDIVVLLDEASLRDYSDKRKPGGVVIVNSDLIKEVPYDDVTVLSAPFSSTAEATGNDRCFNLVVGGYLAAYTKIVPIDALRAEMLKRTARDEEQAEIYGKAYDMGVALVKE